MGLGATDREEKNVLQMNETKKHCSALVIRFVSNRRNKVQNICVITMETCWLW